jgi:hypothetical protein
MRRFLNVTVATFVLCSFGVAAFAANVTPNNPRSIATRAPIVLPTPRPHPTPPHVKNPKNH